MMKFFGSHLGMFQTFPAHLRSPMRMMEIRRLAMKTSVAGTLVAILMSGLPALALGEGDDFRGDRKDLRQDKRDVHKDEKDLGQDRKDLGGDTQDLRRDEKDLRHDRKDI